MFSSSVLCLLVMGLIHWTVSVAIHKDADILKKPHREDRQLNALPFYDDDTAYAESRWESAEWPREFRNGRGRDNSYESEEKPYSWFYYNKYLTNGRFNHLYNGPGVDSNAGMGDSGGHPPRVLPPPQPSFGRSNVKNKGRK